jgi:glycosyltransferase involved in cell wall biosynthesis
MVSVVLAVHNGARTLATAVSSVLRQSVDSLELVIVDDGSTDNSTIIAEGIEDSRLRLIRLEEKSGLANALNVGVSESSGRFIARLDADDIALPNRLEQQLKRLQQPNAPAILGTSAFELVDGRPRRLLRPMLSAAGVRWSALFGAPFLHPTTIFDRSQFKRLGLRYDAALGESEDYDLWTRALDHLDGGNISRPLVLYRVHQAQASQQRRRLQEEIQREVARRTMRRWLPVGEDDRALWEGIWSVGAGKPPPATVDLGDTLNGFLDLACRYLESNTRSGRDEVMRSVAITVLRRLRHVPNRRVRVELARRAFRVDPALTMAVPRAAITRTRTAASRRDARRWLHSFS